MREVHMIRIPLSENVYREFVLGVTYDTDLGLGFGDLGTCIKIQELSETRYILKFSSGKFIGYFDGIITQGDDKADGEH